MSNAWLDSLNWKITLWQQNLCAVKIIQRGNFGYIENQFLQIIFSNKVVTRQPDVAKTSLISKVWETFKENEKSLIEDTIVAAYGNKDTDVKGYVNSGLPKEK